MTLRYDPAAVARQFDTSVGLSLAELAVSLGVARERAWLLVEPFIVAGIVEERDGRLVVMDPLVLEVFAQMEELPA